MTKHHLFTQNSNLISRSLLLFSFITCNFQAELLAFVGEYFDFQPGTYNLFLSVFLFLIPSGIINLQNNIKARQAENVHERACKLNLVYQISTRLCKLTVFRSIAYH